MLGTSATLAPLASAKILLVPLGILGFLIFLLLLGGLALGSALGLISAITWVARAPGRLTAKRAARRRSAQT